MLSNVVCKLNKRKNGHKEKQKGRFLHSDSFQTEPTWERKALSGTDAHNNYVIGHLKSTF